MAVSQTSASFKSLLRKLYHMVHPDRLSGRPFAQQTNLESFQRLQSLLQRTDPASAVTEQIRFHLAADAASDRSLDNGRPLKVVVCTLRGASLDGDLRHLLRLCGLEPGPSTGVAASAHAVPGFGAAKTWARTRGSGGQMQSWWALRQPKALSRESSMSAFLERHAAEQRAALAESARFSAEVEAQLHELWLRHNVNVVLLDRWIPSVCTRMLSNLREQLELGSQAQRDVLRGARVAVSANADGMGALDNFGTLFVAAQLIHRKSLVSLAERVDATELARGRELAREVSTLERAAADALHLREVRAVDGTLRAHSRYSAFLRALAASSPSAAHLDAWARATALDAAADARMPADGALNLGDAAPPADGGGRRPGGGVQTRLSLWTAVVEKSAALEETHRLRHAIGRRHFFVPIHASPHAIAQFLGTAGVLVATQMCARGEALDAARRHIGAKRLSADPSLSDEQVASACARLGNCKRRMCSELSLHLSHSFSAEENGVCKIRFDFEY